MKKIIYLLLIAFSVVNVACETDIEHTVLHETQPKVGSPEYYANLRAYKKSEHSIAYGWWGRSGTTGTSDMGSRYIALPDSIDIVSLWSGRPKTEADWEELRFCQQVKGTRFVTCMFGSAVDRLMRKNFPELCTDEENLWDAIDAVAISINDSVKKYGLDGFDLDYEPNYGDGGVFGKGGGGIDEGGDKYTQRLFFALSQFMGPQSGTGKLLIIDGEFEPGIEPQIDYYVSQAYGTNSFSDLQDKYDTFGKGACPTYKFVCAENMEQYSSKGAEFFYNGENIGSVLGMAMWNPKQGRKGGFSGYILESDFASKPYTPYYYIRTGIQIQNPALK